MQYCLPEQLTAQFSPEDILDQNATVDDCHCGCRVPFTVQDGLLNLHGRPIFDKLLVKGDLMLTGNQQIQRLPDLLAVTGSIFLSDCLNLKVLPSRTYACESIHMDGINVRELPETMSAGRLINMEDCPNVVAIPEGVRTDLLHAAGCSNLKSIAPGLEFFILDLSETAITELPADLTIKNELRLRHCAKLGAVDEGVTVKTFIDVTGCDVLFTLPRSVQPAIAATNGMLLANDRVFVPKMPGNEVSMCLGRKAIEAFPCRHFKNFDRMQVTVASIHHITKGAGKGHAFGILNVDRPRNWDDRYLSSMVSRLTVPSALKPSLGRVPRLR